MPPALHAPLPRIAGRYEPIVKLASGGMASVYLARAVMGSGLGKLVALKCVHPHMAESTDFIAMFLDEARLASRIDHPNVCQVFDAGEDEGSHFIAMEYLHGEAVTSLLRSWNDEGHPPGFVELTCRIIADAALGLHAAHELRGADGGSLGVVHRDVSPQNLFVTYAGAVKVVDFGIAKAADRLYETSQGAVKGKLAYMSPEQLLSTGVDRRTDVWALGVTMWELLTRRRLFRREHQLATVAAVCEEQVPPPSRFEPAVPPELDAIVLRALERKVSARHPTARALADDLEAFIASRGSAVGMSQLSDLMGATYATQRANKDAMLADARAARDVTPPSSDVALEDQTQSAVRARGATETKELPVHRSYRTAAAVGIVLVGLLSGVFLAASFIGDEPADPPSSTAPAPIAEDRAPAPEVGAASPSNPEPTAEAPPEAAEPGAAIEAPPALAEPPSAQPPSAQPPSAERAPSSGRARRERSAPVARVERPAEAPAPATRSLRIAHPGGGWAELRLDGRPVHGSPTTLPGLRVGAHELEYRPLGEGPWRSQTVTIPPGTDVYVHRIRLPAAE